MRVVAVVSGGLDSVVLAHLLAHQADDVAVLSVDYGQRHRKEIGYAIACAKRLGALIEVADLTAINPLLQGSALTTADKDVPEGHYADESMKATIVPNRNALLLSVAVAWCVSLNYDAVAIGVHGGDHPIYPDCRPEFVHTMATALYLGNLGSTFQGVLAPFLTRTKADIVRTGADLLVPFEATWSCYKGERTHCGRCGTCTERQEAFRTAGVPDPTEYA